MDDFTIPALVLPACLAVEIDVGAAAVPAEEALPHAVLASADVVKERRGGIGPIAFRAPGYFEGVMIAAALIVIDREHSGEIVPPVGLLSEIDTVAPGYLPNLKVANGIVRERVAAGAAFIVAPAAFQRAYRDAVSPQAQFGHVIDPKAQLATSLARTGIPAGLLTNPELDFDLRKRGS